MSSLNSFVTETLSKHLDKFLEDINPNQLHFHLWRGKVSLSSVQLKTSPWNSLLHPVGLVLSVSCVVLCILYKKYTNWKIPQNIRKEPSTLFNSLCFSHRVPCL